MSYPISAFPAQFEISERVLGVSEGLAPRAPEMSDRNVNKTTKTIAREIDRNVIHLKNMYMYYLYMHEYMNSRIILRMTNITILS